MNPDSPLSALLQAEMKPGCVSWIGLRPTRRVPLLAVEAAIAKAGQGLDGDHYQSRTNGPRQVTLIQSEHLPAIASYLNQDAVRPEMLRRNIVVTGINLLALKGKRFQIGNAVFEYSGECHPCSRMEEILGTGGYNAVRGHGGITARVLSGGVITLGQSVRIVDRLPHEE